MDNKFVKLFGKFIEYSILLLISITIVSSIVLIGYSLFARM